MDVSELPLRDIHLPDAVSWFPPAPLYWIVPLIALAAIGLYFTWRRRTALARAAKAELTRIESRYREHKDPHRVAGELSALLRRVALVRDAGRTAGLTGDAWLEHLAQTAPALATQHVLLTAPYTRGADFDVAGLIAACRDYFAGGKGGHRD